MLTLVGAGLGIHLGNASVAEINPQYFSERQTRFHADLSPNRSRPTDIYRARQDMGDAGLLGSGCLGCRDFPEEYYPDHDPAVDSPSGSDFEPQAELRLASLEEQSSEEVEHRQASLDRIQRYAGFAISSEDATAPSSVAAEASAVQGDEVLTAD
jgi:hypothetical protein